MKMATYLKRTSKLFNPSSYQSYSHVDIRDILCPVCMGILIEPVTLPCEHNLCLRCLNGTIQHNSLNCPLCRVRVSSWLRSAGKSKTLVNDTLWNIIQTKFPKEVEGKKNGDDSDINFDSNYTARTRILSTAGEIRKEYETQLLFVEEERRRKEEAETIASEALIRKLQAEEQERLEQLAKDELLAKTLAQEEVIDKYDRTKRFGESSRALISNNFIDKTKTEVELGKNMPKIKSRVNSIIGPSKVSKSRISADSKRMNIALLSKIRADTLASSINVCKDPLQKNGSYKSLPAQNAVTILYKNDTTSISTQSKSSCVSLEPGCSKIYGVQSKEELHVPNDVLSMNKKSLGVEVCLNKEVTDDARIGGAESAGSHDSINQEIHHFKPIKAVPRTPLRLNRDGRQVDIKLIRVLPLKKVSNGIPKPPSPSRLKRIIGCSWSAFRGRMEDSKSKVIITKVKNSDTNNKLNPSQVVLVSDTSIKPEYSGDLSITAEMKTDSNKNYTKYTNKVIVGTELSKKLNLECENSDKIGKSGESPIKNGLIGKCKSKKMLCNHSETHCDDNRNADGESFNSMDSDLSEATSKKIKRNVIENIAERIKRRKTNIVNRTLCNNDDKLRRSLRKKTTVVKYVTGSSDSLDDISDIEDELPKQKRMRKTAPKLEKESKFIQTSPSKMRVLPPKLAAEVPIVIFKKTRAKKSGKTSTVRKSLEDEQQQMKTEDSRVINNDDEVIDEQKRIEQLLRQERDDRELAERLQAQFNDLERVAGRTRNSRRILESTNVELSTNLKRGRQTELTTIEKVNQIKSKGKRKKPQ